MPTLQHGARHFLNLGAGQVLTVTCDAVSSAVVRSYPIAPGGEATGQSAVAASGTYTRGPFMSATRWAVEAAGSGVSYAIAGSADADATVDTSGNVAANGSPVSGAGSRKFATKGWVGSLFDTLAQWTMVYGAAGGRVLNTTQQYDGNNTIAVTPSSASDGIQRTFGTTFKIAAGTMIYLVVDVPDAALGQGLNIPIGFSSDARATKSLNYTFGANWFKRAGRHILPVKAGEDGTTDLHGNAWSSTGGQAWGDDFNHCRVLVNSAAGGITINVCAIIFGSRSPNKVVWTIDNVRPTLISTVLPMLKAAGMRATLCMDGDLIAGNVAAVKTALDDGHELGLQGIGHINYTTGGNDALLDGHITQCFAACTAAGLPQPKVWAFPVNATNATTDAIVQARGFTYARGGNSDILAPVGTGLPESGGGMVRAGFCQPVGNNFLDTPAYKGVKNRVDAADNSGGYFHQFVHGVSSNPADWTVDASPDTFGKNLDYLLSKGFTSVLASQVLADSQAQVWL